MGIILTIGYILFFILLIYKWKYFYIEGLSYKIIIVLFLLKIFTCFILTIIYSKYYTERSAADIFKYFDDSKYIYNALFINPVHYLQLVFGINSDAEYLQVYVQKTVNWLNQTDYYLKITNQTNNNFYESTRLITRVNAIFRIFSFGYYYVHCIFMIFISLIGQFAIFKTFYPFLKTKKKELILFIFITPSILLWSSGILKENIVFLGLGIFIFNFFKIINKTFNYKTFLYLAISLYIIFISKYYILIALIPSSFAALLITYTNKKGMGIKYLIVNLFLLFIFLNFRFIFPSINPLEKIAEKQRNLIRTSKGGTYILRENKNKKDILYISSEKNIAKNNTDNHVLIALGTPYKLYINGEEQAEISYIKNDSSKYKILFTSQKAGSYIEIKKLKPTIYSFVTSIPGSLINTFFRPFVFESKSLMILFAAIENLFLILFIIICSIFKEKNIQNKNIMLFCINFSIVLNILIGLTNPVLGTIVRFRIFSILLLLLASLIILDREKLKNYFKSLYARI
ncbi:MAG: hypothetical protein WC223_04555 [Bacteroidales bacterium]|jgi:hypothetical protein